MKRVGTFFLILLSWGFSSVATEVDDTTSYYRTIADGEDSLNSTVQDIFDQTLAAYSGCKEDVFLRQLAYKLTGDLFYGSVQRSANSSKILPKVYSGVANSIYKGTPFEPSIVGKFFGLGPIISVNGHHIGTDKLSHFLDIGYELFYDFRMHQSMDSIFAIAIGEEEGILGDTTTGVKSYGDIAADLDGFRFWQQVLGKDVRDPYFVCENGKMKQVRKFRWSEYVNAAWTEAINCSEYSSSAIAKNVELLETKNGARFRCPIEPQKCEGLRKIYSDFFPGQDINKIVSPRCR